MEEKLSYCLPKSERIYLKEAIKEVFAEGKSFVAYPFRIIYLTKSNESSQSHNKDSIIQAKMMVSVPKKYFKRAVDRNRVKRLIRENYRLNKHELIEVLKKEQCNTQIIFINVARELPSFKQCNKGMNKALTRIIKEISNEANQ